MINPDQQEMFDVLDKQRQHQLQVDRALKIVLPITAFLLTMICANMNVWSTVFTFIVLWAAFFAVTIKKHTLWYWVVGLLVYCFVDNLLSYGEFHRAGFNRQFITMTVFLMIFGIGRRYFDRWWMEKNKAKF